MGAFAGDLDSGPVISNSPRGASRLPLRSTHAHQGRSDGMLSMAAETGKRGAVLAEPSPSSALFVVGLSSARGQLPRLVFPLPRLADLAVLPNLPNGWEETRRERDLHEAHDICDMSEPWKTSLWLSRLDIRRRNGNDPSATLGATRSSRSQLFPNSHLAVRRGPALVCVILYSVCT